MKKLLSIKPLSTDFGLLLLRVIFFGFMVFNHGIGKFNDLTGGGTIDFYDFDGAMNPSVALGLAVFGELVCGALILLGLFTRLATIPMIITMLVAAIGAHGDSVFGKGEHALMFGAAALVLFFTGPGKYSVDKVIFK